MQTIGDRIRARREHLGWTQAKLAEQLNIKVGTLSGYERDYRMPDARMLQLISVKMDVTSDYLLGLSQLESNPPKRVVPIIGTIRADLPLLATENLDGYLEVPENLRADYILRVQGDSMIGAGILDGDLAICQEAIVPQTGQIIVALRDEGSLSEATLKFYMNGNGNPVLRAANPTFADTNYKDGYRTAGVMVALVRNEVPGFQVYKNYIAMPGYDEWAEVIELATGTGIKPERMKSFIEMINEMRKGK